MSTTTKQFAVIFILICVVGIVTYTAAVKVSNNSAEELAQATRTATLIQARKDRKAAQEAAATNYRNQLSACSQSNPLRESVALAIGTAALTAADPGARAKYQEALTKQLTQPFIRPNGSKECLLAVAKP